ncbi:MAG TPA: ABC transporter permease [Propionibacteriaceae bacterium]|nr:ABC transporter permease [Propionibacteriaceae bacterium]
MFVVYYTLVTSTVARREEHMLKRLYTSSARPATVLFAMAVPAILLMLMQVIVGGVAVTLLVGLDNPEHLWLLVPTMAAAAAVWCLLALALAIFTRSVEAAQLTTLPLIRVALGVSGLSVPLAVLPEVGQTLAQLSPMFPVVDLVHLSLGTVRVSGDVVTRRGVLVSRGDGPGRACGLGGARPDGDSPGLSLGATTVTDRS